MTAVISLSSCRAKYRYITAYPRPVSEIRMVSIARAAEFKQLQAERLDLS
jgi:hypothetical protein